MKVAYVGFGDLGKQVRELVHQIYPRIQSEVIFDDYFQAENNLVTEAYGSYLDERFSSYCFFVCLGYNQLKERTKVLELLFNSEREVGILVHPSCVISPSAKVGEGSILFPGCILGMNAILGRGVILNNSVIISHDSVVGNSSFLAPGVIVSGNVGIEEMVFVGAGSKISNNVCVGSESKIGIGSCLTMSVPKRTSGIGNPFVVLDRPLKLI